MSKADSKRPIAVDEDVDDLDGKGTLPHLFLPQRLTSLHTDVLEQFNSAPKLSGATASKPQPGKEKAAAANPAAARKLPESLEDLDLSEDFARELAEGMAALMREIAADAGDKPEENLTGTEHPPSKETLEKEAQFRKAWEDMLVEGMNGALDIEDFGGVGKGKGPAKPGEAAKADVPEDSFQASIKKAMEKLKESDSTLQVRVLASACRRGRGD
jgi:peroxin-19